MCSRTLGNWYKISGKIIKIKGIPSGAKSKTPYEKIFIPTSGEYIASNDLSQSSHLCPLSLSFKSYEKLKI